MHKHYQKYDPADIPPKYVGLDCPKERDRRIKEGLPLCPPKFYPGELVYCSFVGANVPLLSVTWDTWHGVGGLQWYGSAPGVGKPLTHFAIARADRPTHQYRRVDRDCWELVATLPPTDMDS